MANRIRGITVEIGGDTTKLEKALKGVNSKIRNTQSQLKDVEKLLKIDPGNTELLSQRQKLLADAVSETKQKLETLKTAAEQANKALASGDISKEQYDALQREIIETTKELKNLEDQARESGTALQKLAVKGEKLKDVGDAVSGAGKKLLPVTAAVTGLGAAAVKTTADFDAGMSKVAAISGATGEELDALRKKAREMGSKTKFSASEAAAAMEYMAMAGWKTEDMLGGIEGVMNLAAASGESLSTTSDIVTDALTAFGLTAKDSGHFADVLAAASSNANTNVSMMGETFKYAAPIAGALGFSVEDTAEAIGLMANAGIKSSQAGTSLRTIMNSLAGEVKFCGKELGEVTIETTNADGSMRDLSDILADCRVAFSKLSESEQASAAGALVGKNAMSGFLALMNAGEADVKKLSNAISTCDGTSEEMSATMQDNLGGQLTILKSQLEELAISFGEMLMPVIRDIVGWLQGLVDKLNSMDEGTRKTILTVAAFAAAAGPVLIIVGKIISAVGTILTIVPKVAAAIKAVKAVMVGLNAVMMANPISLIIAAIAALVAAFVWLWNNCEEFRQFWIDLWEAVKNIAIKVWNGIRDFLTRAWEAIKTVAETVWNAVSGFFIGIWTAISETATTIWTAVSDFIGGIMQGIWDTITSIWNAIYETISPLLEALRYLFETVFQAVQILIGMAMDWVSEKISAVWNAIVGFLKPILEGIRNTVQTVWNGIKTAISTALSVIQNIVTTVWNAISGFFSTILGTIGNIISSAWNGIKNTVTGLMDGIRNAVVSIWENIKTAVGNTVGGIVDAVRNGFMGAVNFVKDLAVQAFSWGRDIIMGIVDGIKGAVGKVADAVRGVADTIRSWLHFSVPDEGPLTDYEKWMPDFMGGLAKGIEKSRGLIKTAIGNVAEDMVVSPTVQGTGAMREAPGQNASGNSTLIAMLSEYLPYLPQLASLKVVTDTGTLVGELAPRMDEQLGILALRQRRQ